MEIEKLKKILANSQLLRFIRKHTADRLQDTETTKKMANSLSLEINEDSLSLMTASNIYCLFTNSTYLGKKHLNLDLEQIQEILSVMGAKGRLRIPEKENTPAYLEFEDGNICVLAPVVDGDTKPKETKKQKPKKEVKPKPSEDDVENEADIDEEETEEDY